MDIAKIKLMLDKRSLTNSKVVFIFFITKEEKENTLLFLTKERSPFIIEFHYI